jgi:hypothetical protein
MRRSELLVDYCQLCGAEIGSPNCCRNSKKPTLTFADTLKLTEYTQAQYDRVWEAFRDSSMIDLEDAWNYPENSLCRIVAVRAYTRSRP